MGANTLKTRSDVTVVAAAKTLSPKKDFME